MIIVTQNATATLLKDLERGRAAGTTERCIHLKLAQLESRACDWIDDVADYLDEMIDDDKGRIFLCEDGDVVIIARALTKKKLSEIFLCVLPHLKPAPDPQELAFLFELGTEINMVLIMIQEKMDIIQSAVQLHAEEMQRLTKDKMERQNRAILTLTVTPEMKAGIVSKRLKRDIPEILLVDDDAFSRKMVSVILDEKFSVRMAADGWEAITTYLKHAPDIVFLDIDMPDISGHDILGKFFEIDPNAYIVMLSGYGNQDNILRSIKRGASGFIGKPFTKDKINQYISACPSIANRKVRLHNHAQTK